jgi:hypothetical protein
VLKNIAIATVAAAALLGLGGGTALAGANNVDDSRAAVADVQGNSCRGCTAQ